VFPLVPHPSGIGRKQQDDTGMNIDRDHRPTRPYWFYFQQPGCPWWPQQVFNFTSLSMLFLTMYISFLPMGMGCFMFSTTAVKFGFFSEHMVSP
jgi:hypothetical protein